MPRTGEVTPRYRAAGIDVPTVYRKVLPIVILEQNTVEKHMRQRSGYRAEASVRRVTPTLIDQHTVS